MNDTNRKLVITPRTHAKETVIISARIPSDVLDKLNKVVEQTGRNRNEIIQLCLDFALENIEIIPKDKNK